MSMSAVADPGRAAPRVREWGRLGAGEPAPPSHSYGVFNQSGIGREFSLDGMLDSFTQRKNVTVNLNVPVAGRVG